MYFSIQRITNQHLNISQSTEWVGTFHDMKTHRELDKARLRRQRIWHSKSKSKSDTDMFINWTSIFNFTTIDLKL